MDKKTLLIVLASIMALGLSGCAQKDDAEKMEQIPAPVQEVQVDQPAEDEPINIDQEIKSLDASMDEIRETGFSDEDLSDRDLGI